jgi:fatty acid desaturase
MDAPGRARRHRVMSTGMSAREFRGIDDRLAMTYLALDYLVVILIALISSSVHSPPLTLLALLLIAGRQMALGALVHSAAHYTLFSTRRRNDSLAFLFAYPVLDSVRLYRGQHLQHHRDFQTKTPDRFSYLHDELRLNQLGAWGRTWTIFMRPLLGYASFRYLRETIDSFSHSSPEARKLLLCWIALIGTAWAFGYLWAFLVYWIVPLVWLYPVLDIWSEVSDHLDADDDSRNQQGLFYCVFFKGHETYHAVHHLYPFVPFYRLRNLHHRLREEGKVMEDSRGPLSFLRIIYRSTRSVSLWPNKRRDNSEGRVNLPRVNTIPSPPET